MKIMSDMQEALWKIQKTGNSAQFLVVKPEVIKHIFTDSQGLNRRENSKAYFILSHQVIISEIIDKPFIWI